MDADRPAVLDLEEPLRNLVALCEALRVLCAEGSLADLGLCDLQPVAEVAAACAARLLERWEAALGPERPAP